MWPLHFERFLRESLEMRYLTVLCETTFWFLQARLIHCSVHNLANYSCLGHKVRLLDVEVPSEIMHIDYEKMLKKMLRKPEEYSTVCYLLEWLRALLCGRICQVRIGDSYGWVRTQATVFSHEELFVALFVRANTSGVSDNTWVVPSSLTLASKFAVHRMIPSTTLASWKRILVQLPVIETVTVKFFPRKLSYSSHQFLSHVNVSSG